MGLPLSCTASSLQACAKLVQAQQARYIVDDSGISPPLSCAPWPCPCLHPAPARARQVAWASHRSQPPKHGNQAGVRWGIARYFASPRYTLGYLRKLSAPRERCLRNVLGPLLATCIFGQCAWAKLESMSIFFSTTEKYTFFNAYFGSICSLKARSIFFL